MRDRPQAISEFDASLKEVLIERVAEMAQEPSMFLRRSRPPEMLGLWVHEYVSRVADGLRVTLLFDCWDAKAQRIALVAVGLTTGFDDT